ncbi:ankyrin repeat ph and sec7 domain containing protein secg-related [Anaeramoeba ignava]|uniref:Ankyrin repeat ph and sec7 domain containing protein secg-related n=1 Tax=Anaeramoeba ignava TaxID=1746090 RepID=A0A9Q0LR32_ANAIG|nr:ankyrin repeat ph and sec7 domain containing protein secg-related [Anaeramoeba ignava]
MDQTTKNSNLLISCEKSSLSDIKLLIEQGANINSKNIYNQSVFHLACRNSNENSFEIIKYLIENNADVKSKANTNQTPLHYVCRYQQNENSLEIIKYLISKGVNINDRNNEDETPLHLACRYQQNENSFEIIKYLIENNADMKAKTKWDDTILHYVCRYQQHEKLLEIIQYLISKGVNINDRNNEDETPLHLACRYQQNENSFEIIKYLIENNADMKAKTKWDDTILHYICRYQQHEKLLEIIQYLLSKGATQTINSKNIHYETPLHYVCQYKQSKNSFEIMKYLISKGADTNISTVKGQTPLHYACRYNLIENIKLLVENGSDINKISTQNETVLHYVCRYQQNENSLEIIKYLISKGVDLNVQTKENYETPLNYACQYQQNEKSLEIIKYLVENGAHINGDNNVDEKPLHLVCRHQKKEKALEIAKFLLDNGANINTKTNFGNVTPLHFACEQNYSDLIIYLIKKGAETNAKAFIKQTPLQISIQKNNPKIIKLLIMNEANIFDLKASEITEEMIEFFPKIYSINEDLNKFDNNQSILQKFINICNRKPKLVVQIALNFLYTGFPDFDHFLQKIHSSIDYTNKLKQVEKEYQFAFYRRVRNEKEKKIDQLKKKRKKEMETEYDEKQFMEEFFKEMGFDSKWIELKKGRRGILKDLQKLYQNESTKDFTIICGEEEKGIKVHKLILIIRSELFKGMFLSVQDSSNQVHDYSGKSFETLNQLIYFLYHDEFNEKEINQEEFEDVKDYYQLNENSIIDFLLKDYNQ